MRARRTLTQGLVCLAALTVLLPVPAPAQGDPLERMRKELEELRRPDEAGRQDPGLVRARKAWPELEVRIGKETAFQDEVLRKGGAALEQAIASYERRAERTKEAVDHYLAGRLLGQSGHLERAREHFTKALDRDRYFYWAHHGLGTYYVSKGLYEAAIKRYKQALRLNPAFLLSARSLALCQIRTGLNEEAEFTLKGILEQDPGDQEAKLALAKLYYQMVRYHEAVPLLEDLQDSDPKDQTVLMLLGRCYQRTDRTEKALEVFRRILEEDPHNWRTLLWMAQAHHRRGENHRAADMYERMLAVLPGDASVDPAEVQELITRLRAKRAVTPVSPNRKTPSEWVRLLLHSADVGKRRRAARVLYASPRTLPAINEGFMKALMDDDPQVQVLALKYVDKWFTDELLAGEEMLRILRLLLMRADDRRVIGMLAGLLQRTGVRAAVPTLHDKLQETRDPYAFTRLHDALNALTYAYIAVALPWDLDKEAMEGIASQWSAWYERHSDMYERFRLDLDG